MPDTAAFPAIFARLKELLVPFASALIVTAHTPEGYSLNTPYSARYQKEVFFGAVQIQKNYVSYYLMPVYMFPDLLADLSPALKRRMQGKSCFNFTTLDLTLIAELDQLTRRSVARVRQESVF